MNSRQRRKEHRAFIRDLNARMARVPQNYFEALVDRNKQRKRAKTYLTKTDLESLMEMTGYEVETISHMRKVFLSEDIRELAEKRMEAIV